MRACRVCKQKACKHCHDCAVTPTLRDLLRPHLALAVATGRPAAAVARDAGMMPEALSRLMRPGYNGKASGYEAVARALGLRVALVPVGGGQP